MVYTPPQKKYTLPLCMFLTSSLNPKSFNRFNIQRLENPLMHIKSVIACQPGFVWKTTPRRQIFSTSSSFVLPSNDSCGIKSNVLIPLFVLCLLSLYSFSEGGGTKNSKCSWFQNFPKLGLGGSSNSKRSKSRRFWTFSTFCDIWIAPLSTVAVSP